MHHVGSGTYTAKFTPGMEGIVTMSNLDLIKSLLEEQGINIADAGKALRLLNEEASDAKAAAFEAKKEGNKIDLIDTMTDIRAELASRFSSMLPGTHANFTVRVSKDGEVIATANDCHASGYRDSIHATPSGDIVYGEEGAELAKNVRPRKKND